MIESSPKSPWLNITIEDLFSNRIRIKILKKMASYGEMNISAIVKETASNHAEIMKNVAYLKEKDIIEEKFFGRIHIIRLRKETLLGKVLVDFFAFFP